MSSSNQRVLHFLSKSFNPLVLSKFTILFYLVFVNIFVIKATPDILLIEFMLFVLAWKKARSKQYLSVWIPFVAAFLLYEFLRGYVDDIAPFKQQTLFSVYLLENYLFGQTSTAFFQSLFVHNIWLVPICTFFYGLFFVYSFGVAFIVWYRDSNLFRSYSLRFILMTYVSLMLFLLIPVAPPWYVSSSLDLGIVRYLYFFSPFAQKTATVAYYFVYGNAVAALPSLHTAWPAFSSFFLITRFYKNKWIKLVLLVPIMIGFSVIMLGEHYITDVLFGFLLAYLMATYKKPSFRPSPLS